MANSAAALNQHLPPMDVKNGRANNSEHESFAIQACPYIHTCSVFYSPKRISIGVIEYLRLACRWSPCASSQRHRKRECGRPLANSNNSSSRRPACFRSTWTSRGTAAGTRFRARAARTAARAPRATLRQAARRASRPRRPNWVASAKDCVTPLRIRRRATQTRRLTSAGSTGATATATTARRPARRDRVTLVPR